MENQTSPRGCIRPLADAYAPSRMHTSPRGCICPLADACVPSRMHMSPRGCICPLADAPSPTTAPVPTRVRSYPSRILFKTLIFCALSWKSPSFIRSVVNAYSPAATPSMYSTFPNTASTSVFALSVRTKKRFSLSL